MCGIAGYFGLHTIESSTVNATLQLMKRRGPNGQSYNEERIGDRSCYILHSRLSILDLDERSSQPFVYKDKVLAFNGEIYNFVEIRDELTRLGHSFETTSDTEVLIHALDEWGEAAQNKIEGMWAFALFDRRTGNLLLSRDPFGEKPLYMYQPTPNEIYFGSEIKFIAQLAGQKFQPNEAHILRFIVNGYKSLFKSNDTFFKNVSKVPSAHCALVNRTGDTLTTRYWIPKVQVNPDMSFDEAVQGTRERLIKSVEMRLRSDIPIAFCMSGGVDSNSLISIAKRVFNYDVHSFTILNADSRYEEQDMIDCGVEELGIRHNGYPIPRKGLLEKLRTMVEYHDSPIITISFYLGWLLQREISKQGYHISVSGTASDELFSGYFDHQLMYMYDVQNDPVHLQTSIDNWCRGIQPIVRNPFLRDPEAFIKKPFMRDHAYLCNDKYKTFLKVPFDEPFTEKYYRDGLLQNRMMNELFEETTPVSLHEDDLNAMYFSIENRAPFLDRDLFEFAAATPTKHLIQDGLAKAVLRKAMQGIVPDKILESKRKVGFNAPVMDLMGEEESEIRSSLTDDSALWELIDKDKVSNVLNQNSIANSDSKFIFSILSAKTFMDINI